MLRPLARLLSFVAPLLSSTAHAQPSVPPPAGSTSEIASVPASTWLFLNQLTLHDRNYFITGFSKESQAKFQLSLKYNLWPNASAHAVYVGYTQLSFWNIYEPSQPFSEINFNPGLFYEYRVKPTAKIGESNCGPSLLGVALEHF